MRGLFGSFYFTEIFFFLLKNLLMYENTGFSSKFKFIFDFVYAYSTVFFPSFCFWILYAVQLTLLLTFLRFLKKKREDGLVECTLLNTLDIESLPTYSNHLPIIENQIGSSIHLQPTLNISALVNSTFSETKKRELISPQNVKAHI